MMEGATLKNARNLAKLSVRTCGEYELKLAANDHVLAKLQEMTSEKTKVCAVLVPFLGFALIIDFGIKSF